MSPMDNTAKEKAFAFTSFVAAFSGIAVPLVASLLGFTQECKVGILFFLFFIVVEMTALVTGIVGRKWIMGRTGMLISIFVFLWLLLLLPDFKYL